jgi:hypothetical protein
LIVPCSEEHFRPNYEEVTKYLEFLDRGECVPAALTRPENK